ncbi:Zinc finger, MIZ-type [Dillenia turbinata]|uniref:Zinc finger, MIZ-type n=1 Tax=Dillenia turbinata TaxID=194707 RepID=A0AAN8WGZ9_9MAGN
MTSAGPSLASIPGVVGTEAVSANSVSPLLINSIRVSGVAERLAQHVRPGYRSDPADFFNLCLSLASYKKKIEEFIANGTVHFSIQVIPFCENVGIQRGREARDPSMTSAMPSLPVIPNVIRTEAVSTNSNSSSLFNSYRLTRLVDQLALHVRVGYRSDSAEFLYLCLSLARGIDYAVAYSEIPAKAQDLPLLVKQVVLRKFLVWTTALPVGVLFYLKGEVKISEFKNDMAEGNWLIICICFVVAYAKLRAYVCQRKSDSSLQAALMVLMISIRNACKIGWFQPKDKEELLALANEMENVFCTKEKVNIETNNFSCPISKVMSRYYPQMKMGRILCSLEVKPGYGAFLADFCISKTMEPSQEEKIRLFVAQTDNMETSSCIISPQDVNFLLNGNGVDRRTNVFKDPGPVLPTGVTKMLKYGTNLLQAVGQFNGHYIIVVAFMTSASLSEIPALPDYVPPVVNATDSDSEVIEGPSRISLNCPISRSRIKTPVKGHSCKHLQCFDFANYVEINSRRPFWRCPHCNQFVCYTDIRIDQTMVLKEVKEEVTDVTISLDGSWTPAVETNLKDKLCDENPGCQKEGSEKHESVKSPQVFDLTGDDDIETFEVEDEDIKPSRAASLATNISIPPVVKNTNTISNASNQVEDNFWSNMYYSTINSYNLGSLSDAHTMDSLDPSVASMVAPAITDAVTPALNRESENIYGTSHLTNSSQPSPLLGLNNSMLQQAQFTHAVSTNEYGTMPPPVPRHVTRTPVAIQALPAPTLTPTSLQRSRMTMNNLMSAGTSFTSQPAISGDVQRQHQFSRSLSSQILLPDMASSSMLHQSTQARQEHSFTLREPHQQIVSHAAPVQLPMARNSPQQQPPRVAVTMNQSAGMIRAPSPFIRTRVEQGPPGGTGQTVPAGDSQAARLIAAANRAANREIQAQSLLYRAAQSVARNTDTIRTSGGEQSGGLGGVVQPVDITVEQTWRPTGRMRGSLSGSAYSAALSQFMVPPSQPSQIERPPSTLNSSALPPHLLVRLANRTNPFVAPVAHNISTGPTNTPRNSGIPPEPSPRMQ